MFGEHCLNLSRSDNLPTAIHAMGLFYLTLFQEHPSRLPQMSVVYPRGSRRPLHSPLPALVLRRREVIAHPTVAERVCFTPPRHL